MNYLKYFKKTLSPFKTPYYRVYSNSILFEPRKQTVIELACTLSGMRSILDVECGTDSPCADVEKKFFVEGIDSSEYDIAIMKRRSFHDAFRVANVKDLSKIYQPKSFDAVIALEILEHLNKEDGKKFITDMEKIAIKKVIILTPNGFVPQGVSPNNPAQEHLSGWSVEDFRELGFKCVGLHGLRWMKEGHGLLRLEPQFFGHFFPIFLPSF